MIKIVPDPPTLESTLLNLESRVAHAVELLSCATATAYESADGLQGPQRHLALAVMHLITQAHMALGQTLDQWPVTGRSTDDEGLPA